MRNNFVFKKIFCIFTVVLLIAFFTGCKKKENNSSQIPSSSETSVEINSIPNDIADPENNDIIAEEGTEVKAEELEVKKGKANGIDVSKWQGKIDWKKVKKSGIDFAIIRIGFRGEDGKIYKDSYADYNIQQADEAGILVGVYFFSTAKNTAESTEEAKWVASVIEGYPISYPVVYNSEGFLNSESRMYGLSNTSRTDNAIAFLSYIKQKGYDAMFYAAKTELDNSKYWETARLENSFMMWVARYPAVPYPKTDNPDYGGKYDMWQYTDKGSVSGITGNTDMVVSYFLREKASPKNTSSKPENAATPNPEDKLYTTVSDEVTPKIEVNLRESATTKSNTVATVKNGTFLKRVATGANGWSKLLYNGKTVYAITSYLTTDKAYKPPVNETVSTVSDGFEKATGKVTAKDKTNLRSEPNTDSNLVATIYNGDFVERIGVSPKGWTKLLYNGKTVYAKTSLLTTEVKDNNTESSSKTETVTDKFTPASGKVTAKLSETNLRTGPTTNGTEIVHTLKKGEFVERTGEYNGWTKLNYNGQTVYAISSYLITEAEYNAEQSSKTETVE